VVNIAGMTVKLITIGDQDHRNDPNPYNKLEVVNIIGIGGHDDEIRWSASAGLYNSVLPLNE
jgi:hypothetical protein